MARVPRAFVKSAQRQPMPVLRVPRSSGETLPAGKSTYTSTNVPGAQASEKQMDVSATSNPPKRPVAPGLPPIAPRPEEPTRNRDVPKPGEFSQPNTDLQAD